MVIDYIKEDQARSDCKRNDLVDILHGYSVGSTTYRALVVDQQKVIDSLSAQFNNFMLQVVKGEINGIDDSYPSSGMAVYSTTHFFNEAIQQGFQSARFQVDPRESNIIDINKIIRYLKGLSTLGVKYPKDIILNMFGYIDIDYAGCTKQLLDSSSQQGASIEILLSAKVLGEDTDPIAICQWSVSTSSGLINLDVSADSGSDIDSSDKSNKDGDLRTPIAPPVTSLRMAKVIFLAATAGFWSYKRSDTLVRMSVNTSGENSEILVRYTKQNHTLTVRKKEKYHITFPIPKHGS
ncbi:hypothetical protein AgCh_012540 [Apium graveolens]